MQEFDALVRRMVSEKQQMGVPPVDIFHQLDHLASIGTISPEIRDDFAMKHGIGDDAALMAKEIEASGLPPRHTWVPRVFRRADCFYTIDLPENDDLAAHAASNPGTLRIESITGEQLWPPRPEAVN